MLELKSYIENTAIVRIAHKSNDQDKACRISKVSSHISVTVFSSRWFSSGVNFPPKLYSSPGYNNNSFL